MKKDITRALKRSCLKLKLLTFTRNVQSTWTCSCTCQKRPSRDGRLHSSLHVTITYTSSTTKHKSHNRLCTHATELHDGKSNFHYDANNVDYDITTLVVELLAQTSKESESSPRRFIYRHDCTMR